MFSVVLFMKKKITNKRGHVKRDNLFFHKDIKWTEIDNEKLPFHYGKTKICLMVIDPYWLHAYWEIAPETIKSIKAKAGERWQKARYILRVHDVKYIDFDGTNANYWFDTEVGKEDNTWYINLWNDNSSYCAEIGILTIEGDFFSFARSNFVQTPRADMSDNREEKWISMRENYFHGPILPEEPVYDKKNTPEGIPSASNIVSNIDVSEQVFQKSESQILRNDIKESGLSSDFLSSFGGSLEGQKKEKEEGFF